MDLAKAVVIGSVIYVTIIGGTYLYYLCSRILKLNEKSFHLLMFSLIGLDMILGLVFASFFWLLQRKQTNMKMNKETGGRLRNLLIECGLP